MSYLSPTRLFCLACCASYFWPALPAQGAVNVLLTEVPDYTWYAGCFGTATGNLMGYWDRHGLPNFYTGPTAGGVAPLDSNGTNQGIRALWASRAGFDGKPATEFGHIDDYWAFYKDDVSYSYESTVPDPYVTAGRPEHVPDCIGDFIGLSQNKWTNLNGECDGNIDAFSFVFWDSSGAKRVDFIPPPQNGRPVADIPSGLKAWTQYRGYDADVFSQLADFNPVVPSGQGFSFQNLTAEIDAGYPVLLYLQNPGEMFRDLPGMVRANPEMHGMLAYGYYISDNGDQYVRYKTSWGSSGDLTLSTWGGQPWQAAIAVRGLIGYHPHPKITRVSQTATQLQLDWEGPASILSNLVTRTSSPVHQYVVERASRLNPPDFEAISSPATNHTVKVDNCCGAQASFFRLRLVAPSQGSAP